MSFNRYRKKTVIERVSEAHNNQSTNASGNILRVLTCGLLALYGSIDEKANWKTEKTQSTSADGFLAINNRHHRSQAFNKRYEHKAIIATGTFAQIHLFEDIFLRRQVALKITKSNCDLLTWREKAFLDHLLNNEKRGQSLFARAIDIFVHEAHLCLVLPYYRGTLMDLVHESYKLSHPQSSTPFQQSTPYQPRSSVKGDVAAVIGVKDELFQPRPMRLSNTPLLNKSPVPPHSTKYAASTTYVEPPREFTCHDLKMLKRIAVQLLSALWVLQKEDIIHGDLKPENCFLDYSSQDQTIPESRYLRTHSAGLLAHRSDRGNTDQSFLSSPTHPTSFSKSSMFVQSPSEPSISSSGPSLSTLPMDARVRLGDFGNALHISELPQYFEEYEIQSMPYRAPEVLLGLRFNSAIDVWSLGILLIELVIGKTLFHGNSREEAIRDIGSTIGKLSKLRFSSGKFAHCLLQAARLQAGSSPGFVPSSAVDSSSQWNRNEQVKSIRRLLSKHVSSSNIPHNEWYALIDFLTCLTAVDPSHRISPFDALQHNFLVDEINLPIGVVAQAVQDAEDQSSAAARASKRRRLVSGASLFHSLKYY